MKKGKSSLIFNNVYFNKSAVVVGPKEKDGPLKQFYDYYFDKLDCNESSWEKAEIKMYKTAFNIALNKADLKESDLDLIISGDLNNQIIIGSYALRNMNIPYLGIFSACASSVEGLILASNFIENHDYKNIVVCTSSHNGLAEKQFRFPNEYGGKKPESITSTVTSATAIILSNEPKSSKKIKFKKATIGKIVDYELKDPQDLGRCMSPACYNTLKEHLNDFNIDTNYYDLIVSGDLSYYGKQLFVNICYANNINLGDNYNDCGLMIYDISNQNVHSGGSGCGCLPAVSFSYIINQMEAGILNKVLLLATGALHNPSILNQKESIPGICHAISLEVEI